MQRRAILLTARGVTLGAALPVFAQTPPKVYRIGTLARALSSGRGSGTYLYVEALRQFGYEVGRNLAVEYRFAEGQEDRLPGLAADLVAKGVDVIVAISNQETSAARRSSSSRRASACRRSIRRSFS